MAGEGKRGADEEWVGLKRPCGKGRDEARRLKRIVFVDLEGGSGSGSGSGDVGGDEAERGVLSTNVEEVVVLVLAFFDNSAARGALRY